MHVIRGRRFPLPVPFLLLFLLWVSVLPSTAQEEGTAPADRLAMYEAHRTMVEASAWSELPWQFLGPTNISGRITDVAVSTPRGKTYTLFAAAASGGLWKSINEGVRWEPVFEHGPSTSVGDVTLAPSNHEIVWLGLGEANIFRSSMAGAGVYRSLDGGATWEAKGLAGTHTIPRIIVHPSDPDIVWVASSGHEWRDNEERGVYRTDDGGTSWEKVFEIDEGTGVIDLLGDPTRPEILYAATWQRVRKLWNDPRNEEDASGSGIWRSIDGGISWCEVTEGLPPAKVRGRIGIDLCRAHPDTLYALLDNYDQAEAADGEADGEAGEEAAEEDSYGRERETEIKGAEVYRSDDRGETWRKVSESNRYMRRHSSTYGWVFGQIRVDPVDPETIYTMGISLNVSHDGGVTYRRLGGMHGDHHALWIDPENPDYLVNGNDGGLAISYDRGESWRTFNDNLPVVQFYNVAFDMEVPFHVYGSIQDHGSRRGVVDLRGGRDRIRAVEWEGAAGGEASFHAVDPTDPDTLYYESFYGSIGRADLGTGDHTSLMPEAPEGEEPYRGQWLAPFLISPHNPRILYHGLNHLFRSMDRGENFERISPDLSHADPDRKGDIPYQTITAIAESPLRFGLLYAGTDDGRLHVSPDSGTSWREITGGLAGDRWIARVEASRFDEDTVYVAQNGKRNEDFAPYLWRSRDRGITWETIAEGIPSGPINVVREDPTCADILYVGTDLGVYVTTDGARSWDVLAAELPTTFVHDLVIHPRDDILVIATHGRGMYAIDVRPIRDEEPEGEPEEEPEAEAEAPPEDAGPPREEEDRSQG
jgi:photosystem II stability/assembly factor-like uncharacterized protein